MLPNQRYNSPKAFLATAVFLAAWGCAALSLHPWTGKSTPVTLDEGHFHEGATGRDVSTSDVMERLAKADVVFLGEIHDQPNHRAFQVAMLKEMNRRAPKLSLGLEFFTREDQPLLDDLSMGRISELAFRSHVRIAGGYPYRELIELARERHIRLLGLNLPRRVVSQVASDGWESLSSKERARWPKPSEASPAYRRLVKKAYVEFEGHHNVDFQHFLTAQTLWDSTMAESIQSHLGEAERGPMVVVVGMMHVAYGLGIPSRLDTRKPASTAIVLQAEAVQSENEFPDRQIADYIWYPNSTTLVASDNFFGYFDWRGPFP